MSQSLFYWIIYSYICLYDFTEGYKECLNPYFIGLSILILNKECLTANIVKVSILILLDYLFL